MAEGGFTEWFVVDETWRVMFASELIPGLLFLVLAFLLPESPRWLVKAGRHDEGPAGPAAHLPQRRGRGVRDDQGHAGGGERQPERASSTSSTRATASRSSSPWLLAAFAQFSGINVVFYYGTSMLETAGFKSDGALSGMAVIGFFNMIFTVIAMAFVDKAGRRLLLQVGTIGAIACLVGIGASFNSGANTMLIVLMCAFVAFFAFSLGPIKFIFASEIFPTNIRSPRHVDRDPDHVGDRHPGGAVHPGAARGDRARRAPSSSSPASSCPRSSWSGNVMPETAGRSLEEIERSYHP